MKVMISVVCSRYTRAQGRHGRPDSKRECRLTWDQSVRLQQVLCCFADVRPDTCAQSV